MSIKKMLAIAVVIFAIVILGIYFINVQSPETDITAKTTRVGLLINGSHTDGSFCQVHYEGLNSLKDELNLEIICKDYVPEDEGFLDVVDELVNVEKCKIIVASSFGYGKYMDTVCEKYPDVYFFHSAGTNKGSNLSTFFGRLYQARYLSGIVAGMRTETGEIAYVAAFANTEVVRGINAFTEGVRSVRPDATVHVEYCNSWTDYGSSGEAATDLFSKYPIDVLTLHSNSMQPIIEADNRGIWTIGYNMEHAKDFPDTYLVACEFSTASYFREQILSILQGKFHGSNLWLGMDTGFVRLSELTGNVADGTKEAVDAAKERFESKTFDVFYGPIYDNQGTLRVEEGESMSDDEMLNSFDWYVDGVVVEEVQTYAK